jgi:acyl-[acyl-carrier-protein]-phospholipid O-acyltransferase/long-chain-fatty-acid--[acyl-carrier-protein] ligase
VWPGHGHAAVTVPDARKGEQLVLVTECESATRDALATYGREHGVSEIGIPRRILIVNKLPLLGSGKVDFRTAQTMAEEQV